MKGFSNFCRVSDPERLTGAAASSWNKAVRWALLLLALLTSSSANAFIDPPSVSPQFPLADQTVYLNIRNGYCDGFLSKAGYPKITREGNQIRVLLAGFHTDYEPYCNNPDNVMTAPIGAYATGNYSLQIDWTYEDLFDGPVVATLGTVSFGVAAPASVPALSLTATVALSLLLIGLSYAALRSRQRIERGGHSPCAQIGASALPKAWRLAPLSILLLSFNAEAFVDPPTVSPDHPQAGQEVFVQIRNGECDGFYSEAGFPQISRQGDQILVLLSGFHTDYEPYCNNPDHVSTVSIGAYATGTYLVQVDWTYEDLFDGPVVATLGTVSFGVAAPASVPALSLTATIALSLLLTGLSYAALRSRRRSARGGRTPRPQISSNALSKMLRLVPFSILLLSFNAQAFVDPPTVSPPYPQADQAVFVSIGNGICDGFLSKPGFPKITRQGDQLRILFPAFHTDYEPYCNNPPNVMTASLGAYPPGNYTVQIDRTYEDLFDGTVVETLGTVGFTVSAAASVPTLGTVGSVTLLALMIFAGCVAAKRRLIRAVGPLAFFALPTCATGGEATRYVDVLLSAAPGAPEASAIVDYVSTSPPPGGPPILSAFLTVKPDSASYLLPIRASGAFLNALNSIPDSPRAKLERVVVLHYANSTDLDAALMSLQQDPYVESSYVSENWGFSDASSQRATTSLPWVAWTSSYGWDALNIVAAWKLASGYAVVGEADSGLAVDHPLLRQFDPDGNYVGGNFVAAASLDVGSWPGGFDNNVDEEQPELMEGGTFCTPNGPLLLSYTYAGHGTHTAGLVASNSELPAGIQGACKHCGIAMFKMSHAECVSTGAVRPNFSNEAVTAAITIMADTGVQVYNISAGGPKNPENYCSTSINFPWCLAIAHAASRDVAQVAAAGNDRNRIQFPAADRRMIPVGGFDSSLSLWNESPVGTSLCPTPGSTSQCGSNFTKNLWEAHLELMASAKSVLSTTYPGKDWNTEIACGDSFGPGNGIGYCTGTSMSAPQISGIVGILRSINPLVHVGKPAPAQGELAGIRTVLAQTTFEAQKHEGWSQTFGYGRPDAAAAAERMLGKVEGRTVRNRVTPLFRFYGAMAKDHVETTSPQMAIAFSINQADAYQPQGALIPGYPTLPSDSNSLPLPAPRANAYVLTTEYSPLPRSPDLVPLFLMERSRPLPVGCTPGVPGCNAENRDFTLVTTTPEIESAHADGYALRTIQGYVYASCSPEPICIPPGAQAIYRECRLADDDCATFLESERPGYEAAGYIAAYPPGASRKMGYAYPSIDSDGDGLIDGFERVIGTQWLVADSDGDGKNDGAEFAMAEVATGDPCGPPNGGSCPADVIFADGYQ